MFDRESSKKNIYELAKQALHKSLGRRKNNKEAQKFEQEVKREKSYLGDFEILDNLGIERIDKDFHFERIKQGADHYVLHNDNYVFFQPPVNELMPFPQTYSIETDRGYYQILNNQYAFNQIKNIDDILIQMTKVMNASIDKPQLIVPEIGFLLKLTDEIKEDYNGEAKLVAIDNLTPQVLLKNPDKLQEAKIHAENSFLDRFIGLNYGVNVRRNEALRNELNEYLTKLIAKGRRDKISTQFDEETGLNGFLWEIPGKVEKYDFHG